MKKLALSSFVLVLMISALGFGGLYFNQEKILFLPTKLDLNHKFEFEGNFEELNFKTNDGENINGLLFKADSTKGLIFYLHGNGGNLGGWGKFAATYNLYGYDVFMLDYRGYGKSTGSIQSLEQLFEDNQMIYDSFKNKYEEKNIVILGYSIGSGLAAKLASENHPRLLILQAPYYSIDFAMKERIPFVPSFILRYNINTSAYLKNCEMPVVIFHGKQDATLSYQNSIQLQSEFKSTDTLITIENLGHIGFTENDQYLKNLEEILE